MYPLQFWIFGKGSQKISHFIIQWKNNSLHLWLMKSWIEFIYLYSGYIKVFCFLQLYYKVAQSPFWGSCLVFFVIISSGWCASTVFILLAKTDHHLQLLYRFNVRMEWPCRTSWTPPSVQAWMCLRLHLWETWTMTFWQYSTISRRCPNECCKWQIWPGTQGDKLVKLKLTGPDEKWLDNKL